MECISLCAWHFLFLHFVSQCIHASCIELSLHGLDSFLEIFLLRLVIYISNHYVDGVSITYGTLNTHIWTYATTLRENPATVFSDLKCPCNKLIHVTQVPHHSLVMTTTVKLEHFTYMQSPFVWYTDDPLWDGMQCEGGEGPCYNHTGMPWFNKSIRNHTTDAINVRV